MKGNEDSQVVKFLSVFKMLKPNTKASVDGADWKAMFSLALNHNLFPLFVQLLKEEEAFCRLPEYRKLRLDALMTASCQAVRSANLLELYKKFKQNNIYPIVMKGIVCRQLYGDYRDFRPSGDEDILIELKDYENVKKILLDNGYTTNFVDAKEENLTSIQEITFYNSSIKMTVELHINAIGCENDFRVQMNEYFKDVFKNYLEIEIDGVVIRTMSHTDHFLYLVLHAFKHFTSGGFGIRLMLDILLYYEQYGSELDLNYLDTAFKALRVQNFISDLVFLGNTYVGFNLKIPFKTKCPEALLEDMVSCGVFGSGTKAAQTSAQFVNSYMQGGKKQNAVMQFVHTAFPPKSYMQTFEPKINEKPWLIVPQWVKRWGRYLRRSKNYEGNLMADSYKLSKKRIKLLKQYNK